MKRENNKQREIAKLQKRLKELQGDAYVEHKPRMRTKEEIEQSKRVKEELANIKSLPFEIKAMQKKLKDSINEAIQNKEKELVDEQLKILRRLEDGTINHRQALVEKMVSELKYLKK